MKNEIRSLLINTCGWIVTISVVVFFFTLWLFSYNNVNDTLKESWSIIFSTLSALTTIGAAIIAAYLFNDWKVQHNKQITNEFALKSYTIFIKFEESVFKLQTIFNDLTECIDLLRDVQINLEDPIVKDRSKEMASFFDQIKICKSQYELFLSQLVDYSIMSNNEEHFQNITKDLVQAFGETFLDPEEHSYGNFNQFYHVHTSLVEEYYRLGRYTRERVIINLLKILQE